MPPSLISLSPTLTVALLSLAIWIYLLAFRGSFWRSDERLEVASPPPRRWPDVTAVIPARNEEDVIAESLASLLGQDYAGPLRVVLVDDHSGDATVARASASAAASSHPERLRLLQAGNLPQGWTGKLWALSEGLRQVDPASDFVWLCDADITHAPQTLSALVAKAEAEQRDLVSLMVALRCKDFWERLLIPPFIYFFQKLYPFSWVKDPRRPTAAAAGGCILVRRRALERIGGLASIRGALIDDCTLAAAIKQARGPESSGIWLGLATQAWSIRPYEGLGEIWNMVARTAYTQLRYSPLLLAGTLLGMVLTYLVPPVLLLAWPLHGNDLAAAIAGLTWCLMACSLLPTLRLYGQPIWIAPLLPVAAGLYSAMTFDSAWRHWRGVGGQWKGRIHAHPTDPHAE